MLADWRSRFGVSVTPAPAGGVAAYLLTPEPVAERHRDSLVFCLHGGGYVLGQAMSGTAEATLMAAFTACRVLSVDYRLAPQASFPAALDDAADAWRAACSPNEPRRIAVAGISAGAAWRSRSYCASRLKDCPGPPLWRSDRLGRT